MSLTHQLQGSRFELKYLIDEGRARAVRDFTRSYLVPDEYARPGGWTTPTPCTASTWTAPTWPCAAPRCTGRRTVSSCGIRFYDDKATSPVFAEIKRRQDQVVLKQRLRREAGLPEVPAGRAAPRHQRPDRGAGLDSYGPLQRFCELQDRIRAEPRVLVSYMRQAFVSEMDNSVRVTFDRHLMTSRYRHGPALRGLTGWMNPNFRWIVLELKFTDRFPTWMRNMVRTFNLERSPMAKYVLCAERWPSASCPSCRSTGR